MDCIETEAGGARTHAAFTTTRSKGVGGDGHTGTGQENAPDRRVVAPVRLLLSCPVLSPPRGRLSVDGVNACPGHRWIRGSSSAALLSSDQRLR